MNMLLLGKLCWLDFLLEDLGHQSWPEKGNFKKDMWTVMKYFLWNIPCKFLSLLYKFLTFTTPDAKEEKKKKPSTTPMFVQLWYQVTLQRLWTIIGIIWGYEPWWESLVKGRGKDASGTNIGTFPEMSWQVGDSSSHGLAGIGGKRRVARGGLEDWGQEWTSHRLSGPVSL